MTLYQVAWGCFGFDALLGIVLVIAAIMDKGDAAGRGLAMVYAVGCVALLVLFAALLGLCTWFRFRPGVYVVLALMAAPPAVFLVGVTKRM
ncbi:hypothetical protein [uncultured Paludibaculum sp.]|uniref:hypothetical protein n=1 Tax=uncultured Paludibaculum sp. TaxID=1765020 RepID=UPI002AAAD5BA|nr:hypothetical protein [uncultured Paludibaculum sp.]